MAADRQRREALVRLAVRDFGLVYILYTQLMVKRAASGYRQRR